MKSLVIAFCLLVTFSTVHAQAPQYINYQGRLDSSGVPLSGSRSVTFTIYDGSTVGATNLWQEVQNVTVTAGVFSVQLGTVTPIPAAFFTNAGQRWLGVKVGAAAELAPRYQLTSVPYALRSTNADVAATAAGVLSNTVTSASIVDGTIQRADVAPAFRAPYADTATFARFPASPGVAFAQSTSSITLTGTTTMTTLNYVTITTPAPGYILVTGRGMVQLYGTLLRNFVIAQIDTAAGGASVTGFSEVGSGAFPSTSVTLMEITASKLYTKAAGTYVFYFEAVPDAPDAAATQRVYWPSITATYFPTLMGSEGQPGASAQAQGGGNPQDQSPSRIPNR